MSCGILFVLKFLRSLCIFQYLQEDLDRQQLSLWRDYKIVPGTGETLTSESRLLLTVLPKRWQREHEQQNSNGINENKTITLHSLILKSFFFFHFIEKQSVRD